METVEDLYDAEREAYSAGDIEKSELLKQCIAILENEDGHRVSGVRKLMMELKVKIEEIEAYL